MSQNKLTRGETIDLLFRHKNSKVRIWDFSNGEMNLIQSLQVEGEGEIVSCHLCTSTKRLLLATHLGVILVYTFFLDMAEEKIWVIFLIRIFVRVISV